MNSFASYLKASFAELSKVTWPTRKQTAKWTIMVVIFSIIFALGLGAVDYVFTTIIQKVILKG